MHIKIYTKLHVVTANFFVDEYNPRISLGRQQCNRYISIITNLSPENGGSMASITLVSNHLPTQYNNPDNQNFYSPPQKPQIMHQ
jgi:hypothetical protein